MNFLKKNIAAIMITIVAAVVWFLVWYQGQPATPEKIQYFTSKSDCNKSQVNYKLSKDSSDKPLTNGDLWKIITICKKNDKDEKLSLLKKEQIKAVN